MPPRVLTIAGSDSGGGAGIQADLKTMEALGCYGMSAITAITAQNTVGVFEVHDVPAGTVARQIDAVLTDIGADAIKIGMVSVRETIVAIAGVLKDYPGIPVVVDPVMVAKSGDALLQPEARAALIAELLPLAAVLTPNLPEAEALCGKAVADEAGARRAGEAILAMGPRAVLMKGGHFDGAQATDWLVTPGGITAYHAARIDTKNTHGTGCAYASAIACGLARGLELSDAVREAKTYLSGAIRHSLALGHGHGPLRHGWRGL
ncbi:MAG: bifunctional hydroxymethylpyrimidine kinase/phosphomethylpyrimidine kinase [Candidatus Hydrogenedentes bacterium]|nr:bifunctional hydroxymethylpyrimidine kinase/phosphomethylpyrimidine kinase [Candidatus Hydrogenedentota bacterium]